MRLSRGEAALCRAGTPLDIYHLLALHAHRAADQGGALVMESNERYYRRRAVEERMAAQRSVTEQARAWHSKLAEDFSARATAATTSAVA